jgi:hypothetical protein
MVRTYLSFDVRQLLEISKAGEHPVQKGRMNVIVDAAELKYPARCDVSVWTCEPSEPELRSR